MSDCFCKIIGKVLHVGPVESVGKKDFKKRVMIIETQDRYPAQLQTEWMRDRIDDPQGLQRGDIVTVEARVDGRCYENREGQTRWVTSLIGQRVEPVVDADRRPPDEEAEPTAPGPDEQPVEKSSDALPF